jgi:alpha-glucosidase
MYLGNFNIEGQIDTRIPLSDFSITQNDNALVIVFSNHHDCSLTAKFTEENHRVIIEFNTDYKYYNRMWLRLPSSKDECIYGCGEQYSHINLKGRKFPLWVSEQGVGRNKKTYSTFMADSAEGAGGDYYTTYFPQPSFISSNKYLCHIDDSSYMEFNFKNPDFNELEIWNIPKRMIIAKEDSYLALLENLTSLLGRQPCLPDWVYNGVWLGLQGGTQTVLDKLQNALYKGLKVSAVWIQDWEGKRITYFGKRLMWNWQWDEKLYPNLEREIKRLKETGIRFLGYINPYLAVEGNLFAQARDSGYLVKKNGGSDYLIDAGAFSVGMVDLTNPAAFSWYKDVIKKNMIDFGLSGWMADFGEYLPADAVLHNGVSAEIMHNLWPVLWARCNREAVEDAGRLGDIVFFMRAGYSGTQKYSTLMWSGDQNVDWSIDDGLPSVITSSLSMGMSGFGLCHSDIGGYTTLFDMKRSKELL